MNVEIFRINKNDNDSKRNHSISYSDVTSVSAMCRAAACKSQGAGACVRQPNSHRAVSSFIGTFNIVATKTRWYLNQVRKWYNKNKKPLLYSELCG